MATSRFPVNLGDDVLGQSDVQDGPDGHAFSIIKLPPDENLLHNEVYDGQYISGAGEKTNDQCGTFKSGYMNDLRHLRVKRFTCHKQECPACFRIWARRQAVSAAGYLWAFTQQYNRQLAHWVLSPSDEWLADRHSAKEVWKDLDKELRKVIEQFKGFRDTVISVVRHPSRKRCPICHSAMPDNKSFCEVCYEPAEWYWSPHLHVITDFRFPEEESSNYVQWEAKRRIIFTRKSIPPNQRELENVVSYELGHALMELGVQRQAIRYLGYSAKTHFRSEVTKVKEEVGEEDSLDPNYQHVFYQIKGCAEIEPGLLHIRKTDGQIKYVYDYGKRVPLMRTVMYYHVTPLGIWLNDRWTRVAPARNLKPVQACQDVQPQILKVEPFQPWY